MLEQYREAKKSVGSVTRYPFNRIWNILFLLIATEINEVSGEKCKESTVSPARGGREKDWSPNVQGGHHAIIHTCQVPLVRKN